MKRRKFLKNLGASSSAFVVGNSAVQTLGNHIDGNGYKYGEIKSFEDIISKEGQIIIRIEFASSEGTRISSNAGNLNVKGAKIDRIKEYFFEPPEDSLDEKQFSWNLTADNQHKDILVVWVSAGTPDTELRIKANNKPLTVRLKEILDNNEWQAEVSGSRITLNFLLDKEIGEINLEDIGGRIPGDNFSFAIMADPQGGDPEVEGNVITRMKIHNAFAEDSIERINELDPLPVFTLILGDIVDSQGQAGNFKKMHQYFQKLKTPILYEVGNHETRYQSIFTPSYNMDAFNNFFAAQKEINGMELMLYSFNAGQWHFIVWPDPLRTNFWETHPHYFDWLERDLEKYKDKPVIFMQHVPAHPIGINPLINYAESIIVKRTVLDLLAKHGNVKYIFSGHVHIPIKASFKTAVNYRGMKMINLPPAGYRPRGFGEEDFLGGPTQGVLIVDINGNDAKARFRTVTQEEFTYPEQLPEFDRNKYPLWLNYKWELPADNQLLNGNFEQGLNNWNRRYVYIEDKDPSNFCEIRRKQSDSSFSSLYLYSRKRGYDIPGQDRLPQTINRLCQAVKLLPGGTPVLNLNYWLDGNNCDFTGWCGSYIWIEGFKDSFKHLNLMYWNNYAYVNLGGNFSDVRVVKPAHFSLDDLPDKWNKTYLNIAQDFDSSNEGKRYAELDLDRLVINLGVWNANDGRDQPFGIFFNDLKLSFDGESTPSSVNGKEIDKTPDDKLWWLGKFSPFTHIAGEHRYILETKRQS
ncbi:metallophosphoesterase family protein [Bacteroidota bacterium]